MGVVYLARDQSLRDNDIALKMIHPSLIDHAEALQRFEEEVLTSQRLTHANIVRVHDLKRSDGLGIYDMSGNVWEWCQDWYGDYPSGKVTDLAGPSGGTYRVDRGGSWSRRPRDVRCALRGWYGPGYRIRNLGFRLSRRRILAA